MKMIRNSWLVTALALLCFAPSAFALSNIHEAGKKKETCKYDRRCKVAAAEGGSAGLYLLMAGVTCFGAMFVSSRRQERNAKAV
jgi:hypothetical protein